MSITSSSFLPKPKTKGRRQTQEFVDDLVVETERLIIEAESRDVYHGKVPPSRIAPQYLRDCIDDPNANEEDSASSPFNSSNSRSFEELQMFKNKIQSDDRLQQMYKLRRNFSSRFDNRAWVHPHGTTNFGYKGIPDRKKGLVEQYKNWVRKENYRYLGAHPEIQGIISLFLKKLLAAQPPDGAEYLAEFISGNLKDSEDFERQLKAEMKKLSMYHMKKMRDAGKINIRSNSTVMSEASGEKWVPEVDANFFKKMNIGALAHNFDFEDPSGLLTKKDKKGEEEEKKRKLKKKKRKYCGCKDWKLKKNQKNKTSTGGTEREGERPTTKSTLGNVDTLPTSSEGEDEEEEEEDEEEGDRYGEILGEDMSPADAERIADALVYEFLNPESGLYRGHDSSTGIFKNIQ